MSRYSLSLLAQQDLVEIRDYYLRTRGASAARKVLVEFAKTFRSLAKTPGIGHTREELADRRPVLFWPLRNYVIVYRASPKLIEIVTIAHGSRDIPAVFKRM